MIFTVSQKCQKGSIAPRLCAPFADRTCESVCRAVVLNSKIAMLQYWVVSVQELFGY